MINVFQPSLGAEELDAVRRVFSSNWVGKGQVTAQFEEAFANYIGANGGLVRSINCCTEGLFQSMTLLGIGPGDEVVLPTISFVGAANAVLSCGAKPVFCDVDERTLNTTATLLEERFTSRTKAVLILHYGGVPCEMDAISQLLNRRGIALIEDSACSVASRYKGRMCGTFGDIGVWSFDAMKILVCGDGGMIYCRSHELARRAEELTYLGLMTKSGLASATDNKWWQFEISCGGRRAIMNDISSAIGVEQLKKLNSFIARRREIHDRYTVALLQEDWLKVPPIFPKEYESSYYFYWIQTRPDVRDALARHLKEMGIYTTFRYYPLHWVKFYGSEISLPNAEKAAQTTLCLPLHHSLTDLEVETILHAVRTCRPHAV